MDISLKRLSNFCGHLVLLAAGLVAFGCDKAQYETPDNAPSLSVVDGSVLNKALTNRCCGSVAKVFHPDPSEMKAAAQALVEKSAEDSPCFPQALKSYYCGVGGFIGADHTRYIFGSCGPTRQELSSEIALGTYFDIGPDFWTFKVDLNSPRAVTIHCSGLM